MATLPDNVDLSTELNYVSQPTKTFIIDWGSKQITGTGTGLPAMRQAVEIILQTERYKWQIYTANFGSELEGLVGQEYAYIEGDLPRRIADAFSVDERILGVENFDFTLLSGGRMRVTFDVSTVFGDLSEGVTI